MGETKNLAENDLTEVLRLNSRVNSPRKFEKETSTENPLGSKSTPALSTTDAKSTRKTQPTDDSDLDYLIDQIDNLPKNHFQSRTPVETYESTRPHDDFALLEKLEILAAEYENDDETEIIPKVQPERFQFLPMTLPEPKTIFQDLRVSNPDAPEVETKVDEIKTTGEILTDEAAVRVSKFSIMSRSAYSSSESESESEDEAAWHEKMRQLIKKD